MRIMLQVPEGLKKRSLKLADEIGGEVIISGEACYGACDVKDKEAQLLKCDKIVHYGHTKFLDTKTPVEYVEIREKIDPTPALEEHYDKIKKYDKIGLVSSLQFLDSLDIAKKWLEKKGKVVLVGHGKKTVYPGQILGCDAFAAISIEKDVDVIISIGSGKFHALGIILNAKKPVYSLDLEKNILSGLDDVKDRVLRQKYAAIAAAKYANKFGILISTKLGQMKIDIAFSIKRELEKHNKKAYIFSFDEITPDKLEGLDLDAYIICACPRIAIENRGLYKKPVLNIDEFEEVFR